MIAHTLRHLYQTHLFCQVDFSGLLIGYPCFGGFILHSFLNPMEVESLFYVIGTIIIIWIPAAAASQGLISVCWQCSVVDIASILTTYSFSSEYNFYL